ncbi:MAG: hypothetical protein RJB66_1146 [Pseudomonadota bacterium]|jgi:hypothetical protein
MKKLITCGLTLILGACNPTLNKGGFGINKDQKKPSDIAIEGQNSPTITVTNLKGDPLEGAQILFGNRLGQPFINNLIETNRSGHAPIPKEWNAPIAVTVNYPGHMRVTYLNVAPGPLNFKLRPLEKNQRIEVSGTTTGFGTLKSNNIADFGLVINSLTKRDLFSFSLDKIISTDMDTLEIAGQSAEVPSNITFPRQKESYFIPVVIEKERYRIYYGEIGHKKLYALHGKFPFKEVVDQIRQKVPFPNLVNYFHFASGSVKEVLLDGPLQLNLPVNEMVFNSEDHITPPVVGDDKVMLAISLFERGGYLYPTALHKVEDSQPFTLRGLDKANRLFLSMLARASDFNTRRPAQEAVSVELVQQKQYHTPEFIDIFSQPTATPEGWETQAPQAPKTVIPLTTYSVLSTVTKSGKQKTITREWEVFAGEWRDSVALPEWPSDTIIESTTPSTGLRWEVSYIGTNQKLPIPVAAQFGPDVVDYSTHISFNSIEFQ